MVNFRLAKLCNNVGQMPCYTGTPNIAFFLSVLFITTDRLRNVQVYIGDSKASYRLVAFNAGVVGSILKLSMSGTQKGHWLKVTRSPPYEELSLCEVQVWGRSSGGNHLHRSRSSL